MSGTTIDAAGTTAEQPTTANVIAVQGSNTHVGTPGANFSFAYAGQMLSFYLASPFIADAGLYAALNAASANVVWSN